MPDKENLREILALAGIILILIALPFFIWRYEHIVLPSAYPEGAKIINLSAKVSKNKCLWTLEDINGFNYWWKNFEFAKVIPAKEGQILIFRIKSADVSHSFAVPEFQVGPYEVEAGRLKEVKFRIKERGFFKYLCWLWCSECHSDLTGTIVVEPV